MNEPIRRLLADGPSVIALGVDEFAESVRSQGVPVVAVAWRPPQPDERIAALLEKVL
jgi:hypothetical protein